MTPLSVTPAPTPVSASTSAPAEKPAVKKEEYIACLNCSKQGHVVKDCPNPRKTPTAAPATHNT
ncbi:hypothetical protein SARC_07966 [Sphaeroforma arctica JP610]|uniref:CCHC-type domain-containing protein n=1 Tax=Sphaeroforma arctica JP610 TaxID=667725 RepID=A0A0L0FSW1_9EUKA|nr:hypothetical protein SARC_07966 [Sphaeroforma arctica JP610]KNC79646.1 hypothetical protein SARC_07966 [Sphaeroforma arctica JP610]|eukprot:XP_014153548.1 hypothetical protein SARC_07966 [Sphaeroforma arctica JP610]